MIAGILGCSGCGGTFLDWSLHYLAGDHEHWTLLCDLDRRHVNPDFLTANDAWQKYSTRGSVPHNSLLKNTAHAHAKTHPTQFTLPRVLELFAQYNTDPLQTFYYFDNLASNQHSTIHNHIVKSYPAVHFITYAYCHTDIDTIFCMQFEKLPRMQELYGQALRSQLIDDDIWTRREIFALAYAKTVYGQTCAEKILPADNNFVLQFQDFFFHLPEIIDKIFDYLQIKIDQQRWDNWCQVYAQYQHNNSTQFFLDLPMILAAIVNNQHWDLAKYNMTFAKEVVLTRHLLYNHNYALRAHGLTHIGTNTQDWYRVLEPNTYHNLDEDYL
jgi:hypothetical protein